jgi:glutamate carboxypeptidase
VRADEIRLLCRRLRWFLITVALGAAYTRRQMMSEATQRALRAVDGAAPELLATLRRWVEINSFTANLEGVSRMGAELEADFAPLGLALERRAGEGVGDHLVWRTPAWGPGGILLVGHHDTVFPPGTFEGFDDAGDRVRGPGVLDMKGGLLVVRTALAALAEAGVLEGMRVAVVSVADEEIGSPTSRALIEELARGARAGLVFEAGRVDDSVVTRRKGTGALTVTARGVAAHAGNAHADGVNAIWALARLIDRLQQLTDYDRGVTVNVGTVKGGEAKNTVPALAECRADFRFIRAPDGLALVAAVDRAAREIAAESRATLTITGGVSRPPLERTDASAALAALYAERAQRHGLGGGESPLVGGGSDANTVSAVGVPAIDGLGPRGRGFHTPNEYIEPATLVPRAKALVETLLALQLDADV